MEKIQVKEMSKKDGEEQDKEKLKVEQKGIKKINKKKLQIGKAIRFSVVKVKRSINIRREIQRENKTNQDKDKNIENWGKIKKYRKNSL